MEINIVERSNAFWVEIDMDGGALQPRGPFADKAEAEAAAAWIAALCRTFNWSVTQSAPREVRS